MTTPDGWPPRCAPAPGPLLPGSRAELLISHGTFLHRSDFTGRFVRLGTSLAGGTTRWPKSTGTAAITALEASLPCSAVLTELTTDG